jgi:hypothetical protein
VSRPLLLLLVRPVPYRAYGTPQNRAAHWMSEQDGAKYAVPELASATLVGYKYISRYVLAVFYLSMGGQN